MMSLNQILLLAKVKLFGLSQKFGLATLLALHLSRLLDKLNNAKLTQNS